MKTRIGYVLKTERKRLDLTQDQLADMIGYDRRTISDWENEVSGKEPRLGTLAELAKIFKISIQEFLEPEDEEI